MRARRAPPMTGSPGRDARCGPPLGALATRGAPILLAGALLLLAGGAPAGADEPGVAAARERPSTLAGQETAVADEAALDRRVAEVASRLRCPVCRNQSVLESSSDLARRMQGVIRERLAAGESPEEVQAYFVSRYGEWILLRPEPEGINLLVYLLPAVALLAGLVVVTVAVRRWLSAPGGGDPSPGTAPGRGSPP